MVTLIHDQIYTGELKLNESDTLIVSLSKHFPMKYLSKLCKVLKF